MGITSIPLSDHRKSDVRFDNFKLTGWYTTSAGADNAAVTNTGDLNSLKLEMFVEPAPEEPGK